MTGTVYLVGAGPGDPSLITVRGAELLSRADVVAYDRLVDPLLLELAPQARHLYVGRKPGDSDTQDEINALLVREASQGHTVVRLKGGDPFVFGRGGEECEALAAAGCRFEVVPGVTSAVAAPAYAGIPVTHRDHASWVAIATGREGPRGQGRVDWDAIARADTAVLLMGVESLAEMSAKLVASGRDPDTPAAVIASASLPSQVVVRSTLGAIAAAAAAVSNPAVLVVGAVAALDLDWSTPRPLHGRRVLLTRPAGSNRELATSLHDLGAHVVEVPVTSIRPVDPEQLDRELQRLGRFEWVVFQSVNAVDSVGARLEALGLDARAFAGVRIACVGPATATRLRSIGLRADLIPPRYTADELAVSLGEGSGLVLMPRPEDSPPARLSGSWQAVPVPAYRTVENEAAGRRLRDALADGVDVVVFTAGSGVRAFASLAGLPPDATLVACIGPSTARAAQDLGIRVDVVPDEHTASGLVEALRVRGLATS